MASLIAVMCLSSSQLNQKPIVSVCAGENFCLAMTVGGEVYSWGANSMDDWGRDTTMRLRPESFVA